MRFDRASWLSSLPSAVEHPELLTYRDEFPLVQRKTYLNSCSIGALSLRSLLGLPQFLMWNEWGRWLDAMARARQQFAALIGAQPHEIALSTSVSSALSSLATALDYRVRHKVVMSDLEFPTMQYQWLVKERLGIECCLVKSIDRVSVAPEAFAAAVDSQTALLATSRVYYASGAIQDIGTLADIAHQQGAYLLVDDYQATGQIPLDVKALGVDMLVSGGLKWLLGGPGIAFIYVREELIPLLKPTIVGWFGHHEQFQFQEHSFTFRSDARRLEMGTPALASIYAALGGMEIIQEIGVSVVCERTRYLVADLLTRIEQQGWQVQIEPDPRLRSAIVMLKLEHAQEVADELLARNIVADSYFGLLRIAPYFYNTVEENALMINALAEICERRKERTS